MEQYLAWMRAQNFSARHGGHAARRRSATSSTGAGSAASKTPTEITRPVLERYQRSLYQYRKKNGEPLTFRTQNTRLRSLKGWFRWLARQNHMLHNPASELMLPRLENRLPKYILNAEEAETVLQQPDVATIEGLRDRAILETFYSTGMRRMEVVNLKLYDIDRERGTVMIRQGKGKKDRHIPIGERALAWIGKYVARSAAGAAGGGPTMARCSSMRLGEPFDRVYLTTLVRGYIRKAKIGKKGGCHLFRHTVATLMLENGADIRVIQEMLGHAKLTTTELYTRVSINLLKQVYSGHASGRGSEACPGCGRCRRRRLTRLEQGPLSLIPRSSFFAAGPERSRARFFRRRSEPLMARTAA